MNLAVPLLVRTFIVMFFSTKDSSYLKTNVVIFDSYGGMVIGNDNGGNFDRSAPFFKDLPEYARIPCGSSSYI
ncbi:hypothetical protein, partial [Enterococcus faecium]|uniref:hypothetical protein n=1 Tax=Enterococcus faecium TaxID=1352 RepID=UPI0034A425E4